MSNQIYSNATDKYPNLTTTGIQIADFDLIVTQTIVTGTDVPVEFESTPYQGSIYGLSVLNGGTEFHMDPGLYSVDFQTRFSTGLGSYRQYELVIFDSLSVQKAIIAHSCDSIGSIAIGNCQSISGTVLVSSGDYIIARVNQDSGGNLTILKDAVHSTNLTIRRLG